MKNGCTSSGSLPRRSSDSQSASVIKQLNMVINNYHLWKRGWMKNHRNKTKTLWMNMSPKTSTTTQRRDGGIQSNHSRYCAACQPAQLQIDCWSLIEIVFTFSIVFSATQWPLFVFPALPIRFIKASIEYNWINFYICAIIIIYAPLGKRNKRQQLIWFDLNGSRDSISSVADCLMRGKCK